MTLYNSRLKKILAVLLLVYIIAAPASAYGESASGFRADSIKVTVGYFGGPYYEKAVFSLSDLQNMYVINRAYTYIDNLPSVCVDCAKGVALSEVLSEAGVDTGAIDTVYFYSNDKQGGYYVGFSRKFLFDSERYYYPNLAANYNPIDGALPGADEGIREVETMLAFSDNWVRYNENTEEFVEDYSKQTSVSRFRLLFGMTDMNDRMASKSVKWVNEIQVMLKGSPEIKIADGDIKLAVGQTYSLNLIVRAGDDLIEDVIRGEAVWSSDNEEAVSVDEEGNVTVNGEGEAKITVTCGDRTATVTVNGKDKTDDSGGDSGGKVGGGGSADGITGEGNEASGSTDKKTLPKKYDITSEVSSKSMGSWKSFEMNNDSEAEKLQLPDTKKLMKITGLGMLALAGLSAAGRIIVYRREI